MNSRQAKLTLAARIRTMKRGESFMVNTPTFRKNAIAAGKTLKDAGIIDFDVKTFEEEGRFKVCAV